MFRSPIDAPPPSASSPALRKQGKRCQPVVIEGRKIAYTFWGAAWCDNLETYGDFANRLPRGRSYLRNGSVIDLAIDTGEVTALVSGSEFIAVKITVKPQSKAAWSAIVAECTGRSARSSTCCKASCRRQSWRW